MKDMLLLNNQYEKINRIEKIMNTIQNMKQKVIYYDEYDKKILSIKPKKESVEIKRYFYDVCTEKLDKKIEKEVKYKEEQDFFNLCYCLDYDSRECKKIKKFNLEENKEKILLNLQEVKNEIEKFNRNNGY